MELGINRGKAGILILSGLPGIGNHFHWTILSERYARNTMDFVKRLKRSSEE